MSERGTEARNPKARGLQSFGTRQILELMNDEDAGVPAAVRAALPAIEKAVDAIVDAIAKGGHVIYVGAGTSGRLPTGRSNATNARTKVASSTIGTTISCHACDRTNDRPRRYASLYEIRKCG